MALRARTVFSLWMVAAVVVGATFLAALVRSTVIGLDASAFPLGPQAQAVGEALGITAGASIAGIVLLAGVLMVLLLGAFFGVRGAVRTRHAAVDPSRRGFLTGSVAGLAAGVAAATTGFAAAAARTFLGVGHDDGGWAPVGQQIFAPVEKTHPEWKDEWRGARVRDHRRLGRTDFRVSDIVVGTGPLSREKGEAIVREALDRGVNYIDTSPDYSATGSEDTVGRAIRGQRDGLFLATKFCTPIGHLPAGASVSEYVAVVEGSLSRLRTDYVDLVHVHSCDEVERIEDPNLHEAFDRLKQAGKARFLGFSSHTPKLEKVVEAALRNGNFDVMMLAYHHGLWPHIGELIRRAREEQDMGVVAMKTLKGAKHHGLAGFREEARSYSQSALRWVLSNPDVSCAVISFSEMQHVDEYLHASGGRADARDVAVLEKYDRLIAGTHCAPHCGACLDHCPEGLPIDDVLRQRMYFEDYGHEKLAMTQYARLGRNASVCASCSAPCTGSCPLGIPIQERMVGAHDLLSLG